MSSNTHIFARASSPRLKRRMLFEHIFHALGVGALAFGGGAVLFLLLTIFSSGYSAFYRSVVRMPVELDLETLGVSSNATAEEIRSANYIGTVKKSLTALFPDVTDRLSRRDLGKLLSLGAADQLRDYVLSHPDSLGSRIELDLVLTSDADQILKGNAPRDVEEKRRVLNDIQLAGLDTLVASGRVARQFDSGFFTRGDSRYAELAGFGAALWGSLYALFVCFVISFPIGIAAAIYLEEFAPKNKITNLIEVNINNLAAVPSIVYGLLGLAVILNFFGLPRSTPLVGGIVLSLMTLPTIIIACRASIKAVPPSIREAALGVGASKMQVIFHHVLPLALPGTLTGAIIGLAQALGETAPLLMIGMVGFFADLPRTPIDPASALPVQVYLWAESAERGFVEKTSAIIMVILIFLVAMNLLAVFFRQRFEKRW